MLRKFAFIFILSVICLLPRNAFAEDVLDLPVSTEKALELLKERNSNFNYIYVLRYNFRNSSGEITQDKIVYIATKEKMSIVASKDNRLGCTSDADMGEYYSCTFEKDGSYAWYNSIVYYCVGTSWKVAGSGHFKFEMLDSNADVLYFGTDDVFFSRPVHLTELEKTQQKIQQQILPTMKPKLTKSLESSVPLGIGLLASLIGLALLPKVLHKFQI